MFATSNSVSPRSRRPRWFRIAATTGSGMLCILTLYVGYCYGWWLRDNLLVQRLFQCNCPTESEAVRYAPFILIASACVDPRVQISPTGQHWLLIERQSPRVSLYTADLRRVRDLASTDSDQFFLTDTLITGGLIAGDHYLVTLDSPAAPRIPIAAYHLWDPTLVPRDVPTRGYRLIPQKTVVYIIVPDDLARSVVFSSVDADDIIAWSRRNGGALPIRDFVLDNQTQAFAHPWQATMAAWADPPQRTVIISSASTRLSATRPTWYVTGLGVVDRATHTLIVATGREARDWPLRPWMDPLPFQPVGWLADDRSVLYQYVPYRAFVIDLGSSVYLGRFGLFDVPQPVLALDIPEDLLRATPPP